jgi:hypothetical protein
VSLVLASGRQLEQDGKLDEALDRYMTAFVVISQLSDPTLQHDNLWQLQTVEGVFAEIAQWANQNGQTADRVRGAIARLEALDSNLLQLNEAIEAYYIVAGRYVRGDVVAQRLLFGQSNKRHLPPILWPMLTPWETLRGERWLNVLAHHELTRLQEMREILVKGGGVGYLLPAVPGWESSNQLSGAYQGWEPPQFPWRPDWLNAITPNLDPVERVGVYQSRLLAAFEARRRGTILVLALEAFRLEHGSLPQSLKELAGKYVDRLPQDPYWGGPFEYFRDGLPQPNTPREQAQLQYARMATLLHPGWPCVWCMGATLAPASWQAPGFSFDDPKRPDTYTYYRLRKDYNYWDMTQVPDYLAWARGYYFPIPKPAE